MQSVEGGRAVLGALTGRGWSLLVLDAGITDLPAVDALRSVRVFPEGRSIPVLFCARGRLDADAAQTLVGTLGVNHLLYHPLDRDELLRHVAAILGVDPLPEPAESPAAQLGAAVAALWDKFRDTIFARVDAVENAALALLEGKLDDETRRGAEREAHKLAGAAGSFGFADASRLAREAEGILAGDAPAPAQALRLSELAVALRAELERGPAPAPEPARTHATDDRPFLLVVDADRDMADRLAIEAGGRQFRAEVAAGVSQARRVLTRQRPDVVLLDLSLEESLPVGLDFLAELSRREPPIPAVVLTARTDFTDRVEVARRGGRGFLQKPVAPRQAVDAVAGVLRERTPADTHLLAVDDDPAVLGAVRALLEPRGIRVTTLDDPLRFWETLEQTAPDVLVLDVDMPHLGGLELCRVVRADPRWTGIPVLFLTARTDADTVQRVFAAGADDFVTKPFVGPELVTRLTNRLDRVQLHRTLAETDPLTGLANRRKSEEVAQHFLRLAARKEQPFSLAVIDLDHFKAVNDRAGHAAGDEVLQRIARLLLRSFRAEDVVARWGGEEFVIGMFGMEKGAGVQRLTQVLGRFSQERFDGPDGEEFSVTFSAGIAEFPRDGRELPDLYRLADQALYQAKEEGRARVCAAGWSPDAQPDAPTVDVLLVDDDAALAGLLLHALETRGFRTQWLQDGEAAVEALAGEQPALRARVVLLDVDLPGLDGVGVLRALGAAGVLARTRVVMLTARSSEAETLKTLELDAFDHVAKPFSIPVLLQRIRRALGTRRPT
ncbi:MAG: response regulator [Longimicrobiaceae bacterium]